MADHELTLKQLLWGAGVSAGIASCTALAVRNAGILGTLASGPFQAIMNEAAEALSGALDVSLADILGTAWTDSKKIREAADMNVHGPDETILVPLIEHTVHSEHKPTLQFTVDGASVCSLEFVVDLALHLKEAVLRIRAGRIRRVVGGFCHARAALSCGGAELVRRETRDIALPLCINLGEGIPVPMGKHAVEPQPAARNATGC